jgi:hypothetical protein
MDDFDNDIPSCLQQDPVEEEWADFWESIYDDLPEEGGETDLITFFDCMIDQYGLTDQEAIEMLASHIIMRSNGSMKAKGHLH